MPMLGIPAFAQLNVLQEKASAEAPVTEVVYRFRFGNGTIVYDGHSYILYGMSNYRYSQTRRSINLGATKDSAIQSLRQLQTMQAGMSKEYIVSGEAGRQTRLYRDNGQLVFATSDVAGVSYVLNHLRGKKAVKALQNFTPSN